MKKYRTVSCVIIMAIAAIAGFFIGATLDEAMGGAILFSMIAGIACIVYNIENREEKHNFKFFKLKNCCLSSCLILKISLKNY